MSGFPSAHCRVLAVDVDGKDGYVVLDTGPAEYVYLYSGTVEQVEGGWIGGSDANGSGVSWRSTDNERELGVIALLLEAPPGTDALRTIWRGHERESGVRNGVYLVTWWQEPWPDDSWPQVTALRIDGRWVDANER